MRFIHLKNTIWRLLQRNTKVSIVVSIILMPIVATAELLQIMTIVPLTSHLLGQGEKIALIGYEFEVSMTQIALIFGAISALVAVLRYLGTYVSHYASLKSLENISTWLFTQRVFNEFSAERDRRSSDTVNLFSNKLVSFSAHFIFPLLSIFQSIIIASAIVLLMLSQIFNIFVILAVCLSILYSVYSYYSRPLTSFNAQKIELETKKHARNVLNLSDNLRELKLFGREREMLGEFKKIEYELRNRQISVQVIAHGSKPIVEGVSYVSLAAVIIFASSSGYNDLVPKLALLAFGVQKLLPALQTIYSNYSLMLSGRKMVEEIFVSLGELNSPNKIPKSHRPSEVPTVKLDALKIKDLTFKNNNNILINYPDFEFVAGELNLIVGKSGTGKTTLTDLLTGLLTASSGNIVFEHNGRLVEKNKLSFSYCSQSPVIFDDDLYLNTDRFKTEFSISNIVDLQFLKTKKDMHIKSLSGGERQRIGIARALTTKSSIYIFDEPTASLDDENARKVIEGLKHFAQNNLVLLVTHDARLMKKSRKVLRLN